MNLDLVIFRLTGAGKSRPLKLGGDDMSLMRVDPFSVFDELFLPRFPSLRKDDWSLRTKTEEGKDEYVVTMEVPGFSEEEINIEVINGVLSVNAEKQQSDDGSYFHSKVQRSWTLPDHVEEEKIEAGLKNGILTLKLPKTEKALPKKHQIPLLKQ